MFKNIPLNPFEGDNEFSEKSPKDMSPTELRMLLHIQRQNLKLDIEKLNSKINYTKAITKILKDSGLLEKIEKLFPH
ncbi:MAG: hypothetical protein L6Q54_06215 [Leptospiraceae bacterium]|nr:hypothetical protein [Leptospiraceae bacterium]MCK6380831.1 hypothetical protein [Leptospiraceae bacterium]NUM40782.1 hypothetical protein [Leptospiraceae bacterium]